MSALPVVQRSSKGMEVPNRSRFGIRFIAILISPTFCFFGDFAPP